MYSLKLRAIPRVLVPDDDPVIRHWLTSILESEGYNVVSMSDGREVYRVLQSDADFKAAVLDMAMPYLEAPDLIRYMRTEKRLMRIPVMIITAENDIKLLAQGFASGATVLLPKPFTKERLQNTLRLMLGTKAAGKNGSLPTTSGGEKGWPTASNPKSAVTEDSLSPADNAVTESAKTDGSVADQTVDLQVLMDLENGDEDTDLITDLIDLYLESAEREVNAIKAAAVQRNVSLVKRRAHSLRGSSSTIVACRIAKLCEQFGSREQNSFERLDRTRGRIGKRICVGAKGSRRRAPE